MGEGKGKGSRQQLQEWVRRRRSSHSEVGACVGGHVWDLRICHFILMTVLRGWDCLHLTNDDTVAQVSRNFPKDYR